MNVESIEKRSLSATAYGQAERSGPASGSSGFQPVDERQSRKNVGTAERLASLAGGATLLLVGRRKADGAGLALAVLGAGLLYRGASGHCTCYQALGLSTAEHNRNVVIPAKQGAKVEKSITINKPAGEIYEFWRNLANLPKVFTHLKSVEAGDGNCSHWVASGPAGVELEWDAEVLNDHENELIAWRSLPESQVETAGSVRFIDRKDRGTEVTVSLKYNPPGGKLADYLAAWGGVDLETLISEDLRKFKSLMEAGEVPSTEGQPSGREVNQ